MFYKAADTFILGLLYKHVLLQRQKYEFFSLSGGHDTDQQHF